MGDLAPPGEGAQGRAHGGRIPEARVRAEGARGEARGPDAEVGEHMVDVIMDQFEEQHPLGTSVPHQRKG